MKRKKSILAFVLVTCFIAAFMSRIAFADFESCYAQESNLICGLEEQVREDRETNTEELNQNEAGNIKMKAVQAKTSTVVQNSIIYELDTINNTAKVVLGSPVSYKITVPDNITVDGKTYIVTSIGPDVFYGAYGQNFKEVSIGSNVTTISANAFGGSLGSVDKIEFEGDVCQSIERKAIYTVFQPIVNLQTGNVEGYEIALDDVGAGYSGLNRVVNTSPNYLKVDIELVRDIQKDKKKEIMMKFLLDYSNATGAILIAEGIETAEELECLHKLGIPYGQGYFLGKPDRSFKNIIWTL